ncbi:MAG: aminopeptidase P family protein [Alphaproteobacteria bacterium]|nr:aminopeptidase P family protein [Alphaproteobacteria bacterium]
MLHQTKFQSFAETTSPTQGPPRLAALRAELKRRGLDGFIVPRADEYQGEYVPPRADRLAYLTGFTGSAGAAVVLLDKAAIFTDGRYTVQTAEQVDGKAFEYCSLVDEPPPDWLEKHLPKGAKFAYDPWMHTASGVEALAAAVTKAGGTLVPCTDNPLDATWDDQPAPPLGAVTAQPLDYAGKASEEKREDIAKSLRGAKVDAAMLTLPESIAWLLNIRGSDVPHTPFPHAFAMLNNDGHVELFIDRRKFTPGIDAWLGNRVTVRAPDDLAAHLKAQKGKRIQIDPATASAWMFDRLKEGGAEIVRAADPVLLPKACKNKTELDGTRRAHERDGAALSRFLAWIAKEGPKGNIDEIEACRVLEDFRAETGALKDLSFGSISGAGPNGALPHYRVTKTSNRKIKPGEIYLIDSGGQYLDGTTDVTRTIVIGTPTAEMKDRFTRVLKGHIALSCARFPEGTTGVQLDTLARMALWEGGFDYDHGTGHGVGSYLSVHEGPQNISKRQINVALRPGMIVSNEPGYYKVGHYGIRIENLIVVTEPKDVGGDRKMMEFETLTLAPIDLTLVEPKMLTDAERAWLNAYHARVRDALKGKTDAATEAWIAESTRAI